MPEKRKAPAKKVISQRRPGKEQKPVARSIEAEPVVGMSRKLSEVSDRRSFYKTFITENSTKNKKKRPKK